MNSRKAEQDRLHRIATREARGMDCLICGRPGCSPCHWPTHRGYVGKVGWEDGSWVALCRVHHDLVDGRAGVSKHIEAQRRLAIDTLIRVTAREDY